MFIITLIDKIDGSDPMKREAFRMLTLKTLAPYVLNVIVLKRVAMSGGKGFSLSWAISVYWIMLAGYWNRVLEKIMMIFKCICNIS